MMCFNPKVLAGLAAVAIGVWLFAPSLLGPALPLLAVAACPLGMLLMMRAMSGGATNCRSGTKPDRENAGHTEAEIIRLQAEIDRLRADDGGGGGHLAPSAAEAHHQVDKAATPPGTAGQRTPEADDA